MTEAKPTDTWGRLLAGDPITVAPDDGAEPYTLAIRDVEHLAKAVYNQATLEWMMNDAPPEVAAAGKAMLLAANEAMQTMVALATIVRAEIERRDGPFAPASGVDVPPGHRVCRTCKGTGAQSERQTCLDCDGAGHVPDDGVPDEDDVAARSSHRPAR